MAGQVSDYLERLIPTAERRTNHVYTTAINVPLPGETFTNATISFINDNYQLQEFIVAYKIREKIKDRPRFGEILRDTLSSIKAVDLKVIKFDLPNWNHRSKLTPKALSEFRYIVIREDMITGPNIAELLEIFRRTPALDQPQILFVKNSQNSDIPKRLRFAHDDISVIDLDGPAGRFVSLAREAPRDSLEFFQLYDARCFDAVAAVTQAQIQDWSAKSGRLAHPVALSTRVRARLLTAERHDVEPEVDVLLETIAAMMLSSSDSELTLLLERNPISLHHILLLRSNLRILLVGRDR